jgi:outer membrane receptor protein involved in Fe transport
LLPLDQTYIGLYAQDSWRLRDRVTVNFGMRWEPFFGQNIKNGAISNFSLENFRKGVKTAAFSNAPAGLMYPGDPGFPPGKSGMNTQWWNLSPRAGVAWDVTGNGRTGSSGVVWAGVRFHDRGVSLHLRVGRAVREPDTSGRHHLRRSVRWSSRLATSTRSR